MSNELFYLAAAAAGILLQTACRLSIRAGSKKARLAWNIGKCGLLFCIHIFLLFGFSWYGGALSYGGCIAASCVTLFLGLGVLIMQYLSDRKYPMTDAQKMHLNEL